MKALAITLFFLTVAATVFLISVVMAKETVKLPTVYKVVIVDNNDILHMREAEMKNGVLKVRLDGKND